MRSLIITSLSLLITMSSANASQIIGYQAQYDLHLASSNSKSEITAIDGKSAYSLSDACDGWDSVEDYLMKFVYDTGEEIVIASHFASWEQYDGALYSFEVTEESNYEDKLDFSGFAQSGDPALVSFSQSPDKTIPLPQDVVFPISHTLEILKRAQNGEKSYFADVFFGAEEERALKKASTIIGQKTLTKDLAGINSDLVLSDVWPIQIAYFTESDTSGLPDYELSLLLQENGVVQSYSVDYGDFVLKAKLKSLKSSDKLGC